MNSKNELKSDEHVTSQQPMSRRDAMKAAGLAGAAALMTAAVIPDAGNMARPSPRDAIGLFDDRFHRYRLVEASRGNVPLQILLSVGRFDPSRLDATPAHEEPSHLPDCNDPDCGHPVHGHRNDHAQVFRTWSYETEEPLSLEALRETARQLPASVYR